MLLNRMRMNRLRQMLKKIIAINGGICYFKLRKFRFFLQRNRFLNSAKVLPGIRFEIIPEYE